MSASLHLCSHARQSWQGGAAEMLNSAGKGSTSSSCSPRGVSAPNQQPSIWSISVLCLHISQAWCSQTSSLHPSSSLFPELLLPPVPQGPWDRREEVAQVRAGIHCQHCAATVGQRAACVSPAQTHHYSPEIKNKYTSIRD